MVVEVTLSLTGFDRLPRRINRNGSSGIAQLRKTSNQNTDYPDAINLNSFVFSYNAATPTVLSNLSNSEATQYLYSSNDTSRFTVFTSAGPSTSFPSSGQFGMAQHRDPTQTFQSEHPMRSPSVYIGHENMFSFSCDSDNGGEEGAAFADRILTMQPEFAQSPMEDPSIETGPGGRLQCQADWLGEFNAQAAQYLSGSPRTQVDISTQSTLDSSPNEPGSMLGFSSVAEEVPQEGVQGQSPAHGRSLPSIGSESALHQLKATCSSDSAKMNPVHSHQRPSIIRPRIARLPSALPCQAGQNSERRPCRKSTEMHPTIKLHPLPPSHTGQNRNRLPCRVLPHLHPYDKSAEDSNRLCPTIKHHIRPCSRPQ
jgi:hypothetical protein